MTEQNNTEKAQNMSFRLVGHYARDISLECPKPSFVAGSENIKVTMDIGVAVKGVNESLNETAIKVRAEGKAEDGSVCYLAEVDYVGMFEAQGFTQEQLMSVLSIDGAALVYPFARQVLMGLVSDAGYRAPMMDLVNFYALFMQAQEAQAKQKEAGSEDASASLEASQTEEVA